jgi:hypothetical protein
MKSNSHSHSCSRAQTEQRESERDGERNEWVKSGERSTCLPACLTECTLLHCDPFDACCIVSLHAQSQQQIRLHGVARVSSPHPSLSPSHLFLLRSDGIVRLSLSRHFVRVLVHSGADAQWDWDWTGLLTGRLALSTRTTQTEWPSHAHHDRSCHRAAHLTAATVSNPCLVSACSYVLLCVSGSMLTARGAGGISRQVRSSGERGQTPQSPH